MRRVTSVGLAVVLLTAAAVHANDLRAEFTKKEEALLRLGAEAERLHRTRCNVLTDGSCTSTATCSIPACGNDFPSSKGFQCNGDFGIDQTLCGSASNGLIRSKNTSVVRFPPGASFSDGDMQAFTCSTRSMDTVFGQELDSEALKAWSYVGHESGSIRIYPGAPQERTSSTCSSYDARLRPWYISGSSGPKDVVIVYDVSGSMSSSLGGGSSMTRHDATVGAIVALLGTLTQNDRIGVVEFSSTASAVGGDSLTRATPDRVAALQQAVKQTSPGGGTSFVPALQKAFAMFDAADDGTRNCNSVILFLTDGQTSETTSEITSTVNTSLVDLGRHVTIFSYSMSSGAENTKPRAMACASKGVWDSIVDGVDPLTKMRGYFQFLAAGLDADIPRWSSVYTDAFGLGEMVTVARPVYERSGGIASLVGVVGTDVTLEELSKFGDTASTILAEAYQRSSQCNVFNLSTCQRQYLRQQASNYVCPDEESIASCDAKNEIVRPKTCSSVSGGLNRLLCGSLGSSSRVSSPALSNSQVSCCAGDGGVSDEASASSCSLGGLAAGAAGLAGLAGALGA